MGKFINRTAVFKRFIREHESGGGVASSEVRRELIITSKASENHTLQ
jgi:hypothetical protein